MSLESEFKSKVLLEKIEPLTVIKNEPEIGMDQDIISADIKDEIDIEYNIISQDLIKNELNLNNLLKSEHLESVETQIFIQTENTPFIKTEFENLVKTENSGRNVGVVSASTHKKRKAKMDNCRLKYHCNKCKYKTLRRRNLEKHKLIHLKPDEIQWFYCYHCSYKAKHMGNLKVHILRHFKNEEVPFHCYICNFVTKKRALIIEHFKKHPEHVSKCDETDYEIHLKLTPNIKRRYNCKKCAFRTFQYEKFNLHELTHKTEVEMDDRYLKYQCDKCTYKTFTKERFKKHKLIHLKPEEIQYFYCYHCSYKAKRKGQLKNHFLKHFINEEVPFHCYICNFVTKKRDLIIEHFKKHPEHRSKWNKTEYKNQVEAYFKQKKRYNYYCKKCEFRTYKYAKLKLHEQCHEAKMDDQHLKYRCDQCEYKTFRLRDFKTHKLIHLKPEEIQWFYCYHCSYKAKRKSSLKRHILGHFKNEEVPFHCYICDFVTKNRDLIIEHFKKHPEHVSKCDETDYLTSKSEVKMDDQYLNYQCDKCTYKTCRSGNFKNHKLIHLKPEEIQWFYCYHCSHKTKQKSSLKLHILRHFKNEVVEFHCYMCNFMTLKRKSITEHIKTHSKVKVKCEINQRP